MKRIANNRLILVGAIIVTGHTHAQVIYVDGSATVGGTGATWATAYSFLQDALADAAGGGGTEIHVAQGTYRPDRDEANPFGTGDRTATFDLLNGVMIFGSYAGQGEPDPDARDIVLYETILSGDLFEDDGVDFADNDENSYNVVRGAGTDSTAVLDGFTITAGNADGLIKEPSNRRRGGGIWNLTGSPTIIDCRIVANWAEAAGGGMYNRNSSSPDLTGVTFEDNAAGGSGGGMYNIDNSHPTLTDCEFTNNSAAVIGGGMRNFDNSSPAIVDTTFTGNTAIAGGGMHNESLCNPTITGCTFTANTATNLGGAMINATGSDPLITNCQFIGNIAVDFGGGGILNAAAAPTILNCGFIDNVSGAEGAAIRNDANSNCFIGACSFTGNSAGSFGGAVSIGSANPEITDCTFDGNTAIFSGGAIFIQDASPTITDCVFTGNDATGTNGVGGGIHVRQNSSPKIARCSFTSNSAAGGGGLHIDDNCSPLVTNCEFTGNIATTAGGGAIVAAIDCFPMIVNSTFCLNTCAVGGGAMLFYLDTFAVVANCTVAGNTASGAGGIHTTDSFGGHSHTKVHNSIIWNNGLSPVQATFGAITDVSHGNVEGGYAGDGNIDADPMFVDTLGCDLRLLAGSPSIDAGHDWKVPADAADLDADTDTSELTPLDLDDNPRFADDLATAGTGCGPIGVDMGAYEFPGTPGPDPLKLGDLDGDGMVGITDLLDLLASWGPCSPGCCIADLDLDGTIGITDLLILLANWG